MKKHVAKPAAPIASTAHPAAWAHTLGAKKPAAIWLIVAVILIAAIIILFGVIIYQNGGLKTGQAAARSSTVLFSDDFSTRSLANWVCGPLGACNIVPNSVPGQPQDYAVLIAAPPNGFGTLVDANAKTNQFTDFDLTFMMKLINIPETGWYGLVFPVRGNWLSIYAKPGENTSVNTSVKYGAGDVVLLDMKQNIDFGADKWHTIRVIAKGPKIQFYYDGAWLGTYSRATKNPTVLSFNVNRATVLLDNIKVSKP